MSGYGWRGVREEDEDEDNRPERSRGKSSSGGGGGGNHGQEKLQRLDSIQDPGKRYSLRDCIGSGVCGDVYEAVDEEASRKVAIKIQKLTPETQSLIVEEYRVLRDFSSHSNLPDFYEVYRRRSGKKTECDQIWFVMEL